MPLPSPVLDNRSFEQLRDELIRRIPVYNPEWTDHNASDPGVTLVELFAFLGEQLLFQFNQIPEATQLAFLNLLDVPLRAKTPARSLIALVAERPGGVRIDPGSEAKAGKVAFETATEVTVWPVSTRAVAKIADVDPKEGDDEEVAAYAQFVVDGLELDERGERPVYYVPQEVSRDGQGLPVDFDASVDRTLWIAIVGERGADRQALEGQLLNIGFAPDPVQRPLAEFTEQDACPGEGFEVDARSVQWEISTGELDDEGRPLYQRVAVEHDSTRGLRDQGVLRLRIPKESPTDFPLEDPDLAGTGERPPPLSDEPEPANPADPENLEGRVLFWLRARRLDGEDESFGGIAFIGANATDVVQQKTASTEFLGRGNGQPRQRFELVQRHVIEQTLSLEIEAEDGWAEWSEVATFERSGPDDRHYVLDGEAGVVELGNGLRGAPAQIGQRVRARSYRYGGGAEGNVAAGAIDRMPGKGVEVLYSLPGRGGADAETVPAALERIPGALRRLDRAVTAGDFKEHAVATAGAGIARAEVLPRFHAPTLRKETPGVVSVVVWPESDPRHPSAPRPDRSALQAVCENLDRRRLITTELYVVPPTYRPIAVAVGLRVTPGFGVDAVRHWVELVLRQYLAPLPPYGPSGDGWPLGRRVHGPELEAAALQVDGVEYLEDLRVGQRDADGQWIAGTVVLEDYEVPELVEISVVEGDDLLPLGESLAEPGFEGVAVPVPVLKDEC